MRELINQECSWFEPEPFIFLDDTKIEKNKQVIEAQFITNIITAVIAGIVVYLIIKR